MVTSRVFVVPLDFVEQGTPGSNPPAGELYVYAKVDGNIYTLNSAGVETQVGSGAGGSPLPALYMAS